MKTGNHALIVGGTGMLAKSTRHVASSCGSTVVVSRHAEEFVTRHQLPNCLGRSLDYVDLNEFKSQLEEVYRTDGCFDFAIAWIHSVGAMALNVLADLLCDKARLFHVMGSDMSSSMISVADSLCADERISYRRVLLGQKGDRWLTHDEISTGVLQAIETDKPVFIVGEI